MPESSGMPEFLDQVGGLLAFTCAAGLLWVLLMGMIMQRAAARRRRAARGEPPLPGFFAQMSGWFQRMSAGQPVTRAGAEPVASASQAIGVPLPDLSMLTGDLAEPEPPASEPPASPEPLASPAPLAADAPDLPDPVGAIPDTEEEPASAPAPVPDVPDPLPTDAVEVLRVWRDVMDGALVLEIGGQRIRSLVELRNAELERRFQGVLRDLDALVNAPLAPVTARVAKPSVVDEDLAPSKPNSFLRQMSRVAMGRTLPPVEEPVTGRGIAEEIEDLLQARLEPLPEYRDRSVHVRPSLNGVRIEVDNKAYEGIGEVDDPAIHALLLDVVREWENQQ